ncbi:MAG: MerR family DNA-binding transcriptional regulator [Pseudomonadota bacterium]|nr:MerR family DNA-binding transcriptional regulator [Pseudomonadota bacterium]
MSDGHLTFKQMCAKFDVTPRTLRYYEYIELLSPKREGRTRYYLARDVARMTLILRGRRFGFSLEEIRQWLSIYEEEGSAAQNAAWVEKATLKLADLKTQRRELDDTISDLEEMRDRARRLLDRQQDFAKRLR